MADAKVKNEPNFSRHTIADVRDWQKAGRLEIQPDFQRRAVWPDAAKIMLIDSILKRYPLPKIFVGTSIVEGSSKRIIVDGQQRITAILQFLGNQLSLDKPYYGEYEGLHFRDLPDDIRTDFLSYNLDFNEFQNWSDAEIRDVYNRVNKYSFSLTKQELRRADFPGDFLDLAEELSVHSFFEEAKIFTPANRRRLADVEYTSELLSILLHGPMDKKENLDRDYLQYQSWPDAPKFKKRFLSTISAIGRIFPDDSFAISKLRFRQKSDFYSLFAAISEILATDHVVNLDNLEHLQYELRGLDSLIEPSAPGPYGEYAIRCVSDANSMSSRQWRTNFLRNIILSSYNPNQEEQDEIAKFLFNFIGVFDDAMCPSMEEICLGCGEDLIEDQDDAVWVIPRTTLFLEFATTAHKRCVENNPKYVVRDDD